MKRVCAAEIAEEIVDLCNDLCREINQEASYYQASVYKNELRNNIDRKIENLRDLAEGFSTPDLLEPFLDFEAMASASGNTNFPGECSYSYRIRFLVDAFSSELNKLKPKLKYTNFDYSLQRLQKNSRTLKGMSNRGGQTMNPF